MWKSISHSVKGQSHQVTGEECQDYALVTPYKIADKIFLLAACSDGAGSAKWSGRASQLVCEVAIREMADYLESNTEISSLGIAEVFSLFFISARKAVENVVLKEGHHLREYASTLLIALVANEFSIFGQIGDGCIVFKDQNEIYNVALWPQNGEYANVTNFLSDDDYQNKIEFFSYEGRVNALAMMTDGLQNLALNNRDKTAHAKFFEPFFNGLKSSAFPDELISPLGQFLDSEIVNQKTDDDKTLLLAVRFVDEA